MTTDPRDLPVGGGDPGEFLAVAHRTMPSPPLLARGYAKADVDALLVRVVAALRGEDPLRAADVRAVEFGHARGEAAYDEGAVDAVLERVLPLLRGHDELVAATPMTLDEVLRLRDDVQQRRLTVAPGGYDKAAVDDFLEHAGAALTLLVSGVAAPGLPTADEAAAVRFPAASGDGYVANEVDALVERVQRALRHPLVTGDGQVP